MMNESLYDLIKLTLLASELTYAIGLMRELGRGGQLDGDDNETALKLPFAANDFVNIVENNPELSTVFEGQDEDAALQFAAAAEMKKRNDRGFRMNAKRDLRSSIRNFRDSVGASRHQGSLLGDGGRGSIAGSKMVYFNDQAERGYREQTEMVYGISVDR